MRLPRPASARTEWHTCWPAKPAPRQSSDADDLVLDCLVRAFDCIEIVRSKAERRICLFPIMHNLHVSGWRRLCTRPETTAEDAKAEAVCAAMTCAAGAMPPTGKTPVIRVNNKCHGLLVKFTATNKGQMRARIFDGALDANALIDILRRLIKGPTKNVFLILDNLRVHHAKRVNVSLAEHVDAIEVFYLPSFRDPFKIPCTLIRLDSLKGHVRASDFRRSLVDPRASASAAAPAAEGRKASDAGASSAGGHPLFAAQRQSLGDVAPPRWDAGQG